MSDQSAERAEGQTEGQTTEQPAEGQQQTETRPAWLDPIEQRMNELRDQNMEMAQHLSSLTQTGEEEEEEFSEEDYYDENGELTPEAAQAIIDQRVEEALNARLSERDAGEALSMRDLAFDELRERIPALADDAYATQLVREVAADLEEAGYGAAIQTPLFVDLIEREHKARQFDERAAAETEQTAQRGVVLEAAGGATPQQRTQEPDWGERIQKAAERLHPKI